MVFMYCCPYLFLFRISGVEVVKTVPEQDIRGGIWLIGWLCERAFRSRLTLREEGQVASLESPNGLGAIRRVSKTGKNVKPKTFPTGAPSMTRWILSRLWHNRKCQVVAIAAFVARLEGVAAHGEG
jgi:hypothetical protein